MLDWIRALYYRHREHRGRRVVRVVRRAYSHMTLPEILDAWAGAHERGEVSGGGPTAYGDRLVQKVTT